MPQNRDSMSIRSAVATTPLGSREPATDQRSLSPDRSKSRISGYLWSAGGVLAATGCFWLAHAYVDKGQASLLYLPVVIACAIRFGFGPAVLAAFLSFLCWNFFFLPPHHTLAVRDLKDLLSLIVFLVAAVTTAQLAARARAEAEAARAREAEMTTLFEASAAISREVSAPRLLAALAQQFQALCRASTCVVLRCTAEGTCDAVGDTPIPDGEEGRRLLQAAQSTCARNQAIPKSAGYLLQNEEVPGVFVPLHAADALVGVLYVGPREDGQPFAPMEQRLIQTLANHAATVIARERLAEQATQAAALREADTLKEALLSLVSHELRTPLAAIKASASGLLQPGGQWDDAAKAEALASIDQEADRLAKLVDHLLDLSRLEAGAWRPDLDWCDLTEVIATVLDRLSAETASRVTVQIAAELPLIRADYIQIALVLQNLLENADKYTPGDSPIQVMADRSEDGSGIVVAVRDFGEGILPGEEALLFTRFFRGVRHRNGPIHGTGLGLALCAAIVRAHGGQIAAANAPADEPKGAIFSVSLPTNEGGKK